MKYTETGSVIIVLGSQNDDDGNLSEIALSRCNQALTEFEKNPSCGILCTGGIGQTFNNTHRAHADYLQDYLIKQALPLSAFLEVAASKFTLEDAILSKPILEKHGIKNAVLVTSDFHMKRVKLIFSRVCPGINFYYSEARSNCLKCEITKLIEHEKVALKRDRLVFDNDCLGAYQPSDTHPMK